MLFLKHSEVSARGVLVSFTSIAVTFGPVLVFSLSNLTEWRNIALYCCIVQIIVTITLLCVSEIFYHMCEIVECFDAQVNLCELV